MRGPHPTPGELQALRGPPTPNRSGCEDGNLVSRIDGAFYKDLGTLGWAAEGKNGKGQEWGRRAHLYS